MKICTFANKNQPSQNCVWAGNKDVEIPMDTL